jgi:hypothetical protein
MQLLLPSVEETSIEIKFSDDQEPVVVDAVEVDDMISSINKMNLPEDISFYKKFIELFEVKFKRKLKTSTQVHAICEMRKAILQGLKKKLLDQAISSVSSQDANSSPIES